MISIPRVFWLLCAAVLTLASARDEADRFELRGILDLGEGQSFSLHDTDTGATFWIDLGENAGGVHAAEFDRERRILLLEYGNARQEVELNQPDDRPLKVVTKQTAADLLAARINDGKVAPPRRARLFRSRRGAGNRQGPASGTATGRARSASLDRGAGREIAANQNLANDDAIETHQMADGTESPVPRRMQRRAPRIVKED